MTQLTSYDPSNHAPKASIPRYMPKELGRKAVLETYMPQLVTKKNKVNLATWAPNFDSIALGRERREVSGWFTWRHLFGGSTAPLHSPVEVELTHRTEQG